MKRIKSYFAAGCFWDTEYRFMKAPGVEATAAGFMGGAVDFTQTDGQGPDIGSQYLSCLFYTDEEERTIAENCIRRLEEKGYRVATQLRPASVFWIAEDYHQQYYEHKGTQPYCHRYKKIF